MDLTVNILDNSGAPLTALGTDITLDSVVTNDSNSVTQTVADNLQQVTLTVTRAGFFSYSTTFRVFNQDETISIKLIQDITDTLDPNYRRPYPWFFAIQDPCSFDVHVFNATSAPFGSFEYYSNNELYESNVQDTIVRYCEAGSYQIKQRITVNDDPVDCGGTGTLLWDRFYATIEAGDILNDLATNLALDTDTNTTLPEIIPELTLDLQGPANFFDSTFYYPLLETVVVVPDWEITNPTCTDTPVLTWEVIDPDGLVLEAAALNLPALSLGLGALVTPADVSPEVTLNKVGDYIVRSTISDCCNSYTREVVIPAVEFVQLFPLNENCTEHEIKNASTTIDITYTVSDLDNNPLEDDNLGVLENVELQAGFSNQFNIPDDGTYIVAVSYTDKFDVEQERTFILTLYCGLEDCIAELIMQVFCEDSKSCSCKEAVQFERQLNRMIAVGQTYFMHLQSEYGFNNIYNTLSESKLMELTDRDQLFKKLKSYCTTDGCKPCNCA
jgi:hypothetical protein